jgi:hypothetical protein
MKFDCIIGSLNSFDEKTKKQIRNKCKKISKPENIHLFDGMTEDDENLLVDIFVDTENK